MSKRFGWLFGFTALVAIGFLVACSSKYSSTSDGLVLVGSQGSAVIQSFTFSLSNGHISGVSNPPATSGQPSAMVLDPSGAFAYVLIDQAKIATFQVNSNGTLTATGTPVSFQQATVTISGAVPPDPTTETVDVVPGAVSIDSAGKFLFVANRVTADGAGRHVQGSISVFAVNAGVLTEVAGSPFFTESPAVTSDHTIVDMVGVAATHTVFPAQSAVCSPPNNPVVSGQYLYAVDSLGEQVWEFAVDTNSGALGLPGTHTSIPSVPTDQVPAGIAVDPCNRFVFVSDSSSNKVSGYSICNGTATQSSTCTAADGSLVAVAGSPFSLSGGANGPGPLVVDPFGNFLYVVNTISNQVSTLRISPVLGTLTAGSPATVNTGNQPKSIAIRSDDNWLFVTDYQAGTLSQYAITPSTGALSPLPAVTTENYPWGVAVK